MEGVVEGGKWFALGKAGGASDVLDILILIEHLSPHNTKNRKAPRAGKEEIARGAGAAL